VLLVPAEREEAHGQRRAGQQLDAADERQARSPPPAGQERRAVRKSSSARLAASAVFRAARVPGFRSTTFCITAAPSKGSARVSAGERVASASSRAGRHAIWKVGNSNAASARFSDIGSQSEPRIDLRSQ
jgi:hypothetical protein